MRVKTLKRRKEYKRYGSTIHVCDEPGKPICIHQPKHPEQWEQGEMDLSEWYADWWHCYHCTNELAKRPEAKAILDVTIPDW